MNAYFSVYLFCKASFFFVYIYWLCYNMVTIESLAKFAVSLFVCFLPLLQYFFPRTRDYSSTLRNSDILIGNVLIGVHLVTLPMTVYSLRMKEVKKCTKAKEIWFESVVMGQGRTDDVISSGCAETICRVLISSHIVLMVFFFAIDVNISSSQRVDA